MSEFQQHILTWYEKNKRDLPWRQDHDPYHILISEVMLQQTQVQRVIPKYEAWIQAFPTLESLAKASTLDVLSYWSGLGYNRRALYLQKCAKEVVLRFDGKIPQDEKVLLSLPGIGEYTASAILCFAFDKQVAVVDTNVRKVILIHFFSERAKRVEEPSTGSGKKNTEIVSGSTALTIAMTNKEVQDIADQLLPKGKAYDWNQALMDYAASELKKHTIPVPKQSKFKDSDRYYRGYIIRHLLVHTSQSREELLKLFTDIPTMNAERLDIILAGMLRDSLVKKENENDFSIADA